MHVTTRGRFLPGEVGSAFPHLPIDATPRAGQVRRSRGPRLPSTPRLTLPKLSAPTLPRPTVRIADVQRGLRRAVRLLTFTTVLAIPLGAGGWIHHASNTTQRIDGIAETGIPRFPTPITALRAAVQGPPTVALQIGHLNAVDHPDELAVLRFSTGGRGGGLDEVDVNRDVAFALADKLRAAGVHVTLLDATVEPAYRASLFLSLHADGNADTTRRGYKSAHVEPIRQRRDPWLLTSIDAAYLAAAPLPHDTTNVSRNMTHYYAFSHERFDHAVAPSTAGLVVEMGYLTNPEDRAWLADPQAPAEALYDGIMRYLAGIDRWHPSLARVSNPGVLDATAVLP